MHRLSAMCGSNDKWEVVEIFNRASFMDPLSAQPLPRPCQALEMGLNRLDKNRSK